jgi:hypothetical protein
LTISRSFSKLAEAIVRNGIMSSAFLLICGHYCTHQMIFNAKMGGGG